ncbi:hypothetical protein J4444_05040 [Candidatus Woesearchaeota archaeon]|nr:hypothetical protein [Candidatus Woesearchaeota archaeon]
MGDLVKLEGMTLETILSNVRTNHLGRDTKSIEQEVRANFLAHSEARAGGNVREIAEEYGLAHGKVNSWRYLGTFPLVLKPYLDSYEPDTNEKKQAFTYLLGALSRSYGTRSTEMFERTFHDAGSMERFCDSLETVLGKKAIRTAKDRRGTRDSAFVQFTLFHLTNSFDRYVENDAARIAFLQGFFDASKTSVVDAGSNKGYFVTCLDTVTIERVVKTLFEVGIYTSIDSKHTHFYIEGHDNLHKVYELKLDQNKNNRTALKRVLGDKGPQRTIERYYGIRRKAALLQEQRENMSRRSLGKEFEVEETVVGTWIADILTNGKYARRIPNAVHRYETLLAKFGFQNVHTAQQPVQRHEKIFFPINGEVYSLDPQARVTFERTYGLLGEKELQEIYGELQQPQTDSADRKYKFTLKSGVISKVSMRRAPVEYTLETVSRTNGKTTNDSELPTIVLNVGSQQYPFSPSAVKRYFAIAEIKPHPLDADEHDQLILNLQRQLAGKHSDLEFTLLNGKVVGIKYSTKSDKESMGKYRKDYSGILRNDGPSIVDRWDRS